MNNQNIDIDLEVIYSSVANFAIGTQLEMTYTQGNAVVSEDTQLDKELYLIIKFKISENVEHKQIEAEFKSICNSYKVILTSFIRPIRDIIKLMTLTYSVTKQHACISFKMAKAEDKYELLQLISSLYKQFDESEPGHLKLQVKTDATLTSFIDGTTMTQPPPMSVNVECKGSLSRQTIQMLETAYSLTNLKPSKNFKKLRHWLQIMKHAKAKVTFAREVLFPDLNMSKFPIKPKLKIPILAKSLDFARKYFDQTFTIELGCTEFTLTGSAIYCGSFSDLVKAMIRT